MPSDYLKQTPPVLRDFLSYHLNIKMHSAKTVEEYFLDLRMFFRFLKLQDDSSLQDVPFDEISILDCDLDFVRRIGVSDILAFMTFLSQQRPNAEQGLSAKSKSRKQEIGIAHV